MEELFYKIITPQNIKLHRKYLNQSNKLFTYTALDTESVFFISVSTNNGTVIGFSRVVKKEGSRKLIDIKVSDKYNIMPIINHKSKLLSDKI